MKKFIIIPLLPVLTTILLYPQDFVSTSVLSTGNWYKMKIIEEGIYRIDFEDIEQLGLNPGNEVAVYSNNFGLLSYYNDDPRPDDLIKTPVLIDRGQDGLFNSGDYILFYGNTTHRWKYDYETGEYKYRRHYYSDTAVYFLRLNESPREISTSAEPGTADYLSDHSDYLFIHEIEKTSIIKSGREWYEPLPEGIDYGISFDAGGYIIGEGESLRYRIRLLGRSGDQSIVRLNNASELVSSISVPAVNIFNTAGTYASLAEDSGEIAGDPSTADISVTFHNNGNITARAWLDYLILETRIENHFTAGINNHFIIFDRFSVQPGGITRFTVNSVSDNLTIWDISNENDITSVDASYSGGEYSFVASTDSLKKFIAFRKEDALEPLIDTAPVLNQDLHNAGPYDMIIITHPLFEAYASELAGLHVLHDSFESMIVTPDEIYNEFSGGVPDISAIRNFVRMVYEKNKSGDRPLKYLLLFGDGSYENKTLPPDNPNFIPTYQTQNSNVKIQSFTSDDYYGLLDPGEGEYIGFLDIGIGRLPVSDTLQARVVINKIREYMEGKDTGPWRNIIAMVADDEDNNLHMKDSDNLAELIEDREPSFNIEKIYLDSYRQLTDISGQSYPGASQAITDRINNGCLILNYSGHGNELGLAHERVVSLDDIDSWSNKGRYPAFVTATCEFSRFDDVDIDPGTGSITQKSSAGELVLLKPGAGGIALFSTTRLVFASANYNLASKLYQNAFNRDQDGRGLTMGDIMKNAKINTTGDNKRNFTLLGDPALRLDWAWQGKVITDSINGIGLSTFNDTIRGLTEMVISGHIADNQGNPVDSFNGFIYPALFDKKREISTLANDGGQPFSFMTRDRVLFKGKTRVTDGRFKFSVFIPREIDYSYGMGKISYYASNNLSDHTGHFSELIIGGLNNPAISDTTGPVIKLYLNDTLFRDGGLADPDPVLLAHLSDPSSINTTGMGIGHDIIAVLDEGENEPVILNNFYENDLGTYKSGKIIYPLSNLAKGGHTISLKAWDNFNNSSTASLNFFVRDEEGIVLNRIMNYPNPFANSTRISLEHNRPDDIIELTINIFNRNGALVRTIKTTDLSGGYAINPVTWDGRDSKGSRVAAGIYIYTIWFRTGTGETSSASGRMIIL